MRNAPPCLSRHRSARFIVWARLWFVWAAGVVLAMLTGRERRRTLDAMAQTIGLTIFVAVAARMAAPQGRARHRHGALKRAGSMRALIGARLRKAMAGGGLFARLGAMACVLRDIERHIAQLAKRLRLGLTRRRLVRAFYDDAAPAFQTLAPPRADTS